MASEQSQGDRYRQGVGDVKRGIHATIRQQVRRDGGGTRALSAINAYAESPHFAAVKETYGPAARRMFFDAFQELLDQGVIHQDSRRRVTLA